MNKKLDELGRIVIPAPMRKQLGIKDTINIECIDNKIIITNPDNKLEFLMKRDNKLQRIEMMFKNGDVDLKKLKNIVLGDDK